MGRNLEKGIGAIYHIKDKKVTKLFSNITVSNSICFSKNGKRAFYSDTNTNTIMKCEINEETGFQTENQKYLLIYLLKKYDQTVLLLTKMIVYGMHNGVLERYLVMIQRVS